MNYVRVNSNYIKEAESVTMNIFRFFLKSFVKIEISNVLCTAENCMEK